MNRAYFTIPGPPKAQKRHRDRAGGGKYDPSAQDKRDFNLQSRRHWCEFGGAPRSPITGPVLLCVVFYMPTPRKPTSFSKAVQEHDRWTLSPRDVSRGLFMFTTDIATINEIGRQFFHVKRPDVDNLLKLVKDALTSLFWKDDSQVQIGGAFKIYSHNPRTEIEILWP